VSEAERQVLRDLEAWGMVDVFRQHHPDDKLFSWWDYRAGGFNQNKGMRIDLILATPSVAAKARWTIVDRQARKGEKPSDHAPVLVDIDV
jgi:exodeoxyribonuclease-3